MAEPNPKQLAAEEASHTAADSAEAASAAAKQAHDDAVTAVQAADKNRPECPHCKHLLRFEHDLGGHMHCDSKDCVECCFSPSDDGPVLRAGWPYCPSA